MPMKIIGAAINSPKTKLKIALPEEKKLVASPIEAKTIKVTAPLASLSKSLFSA